MNPIKQTIILIAGFKRSGKDFVGTYLNENIKDSSKLWFAGPFKQIISNTFDITLEELEEYKNDIENYGIEIKAYPNNQNQVVIDYTNFRTILQRFGTEGCKPIWGDSVWAELTKEKAKEIGSTIIIPDFRFRIEEDVWDKSEFNVITIRVQDDSILMTDTHASENDLINNSFDYYINNTNKDESVFEELNEIIKKEKI